MGSKKFCRWWMLIGGIFITLSCSAEFFPSPAQTLQINTHFDSVHGKPEWLLIVRDLESGRVLPYLFDIKNNDNFWIAFTSSRSYKVTVSDLKFGQSTVLHNFCHLEGINIGKSMMISLRGKLYPDRNKIICDVMKYGDIPFPIVNP